MPPRTARVCRGAALWRSPTSGIADCCARRNNRPRGCRTAEHGYELPPPEQFVRNSETQLCVCCITAWMAGGDHDRSDRFRFRGRAAVFVGFVRAADEKSAIETAIKEYKITNKEQQRRLVARRRD